MSLQSLLTNLMCPKQQKVYKMSLDHDDTYILQAGVKVMIKIKDQHAESMTGGLLTVVHIAL